MALAHPEIAERTWDPWPDTYCPSNPRSYELYFDLLDEVIEVFQPRMVHIGHDEVYTIGLCDRCRGKSGAELLAGDLRRIRDYLHARGIRTVLWGDKLQNIIVGGVDHGGRVRRYVSSERKADHAMRETYQAVDFVPKDMLIMDWYWCLDPSSEQFFRRKGFEVIFGNFGNNFEPQTFYQWDKRAAGNDVLGAEVSTWCHAGEYAFGHNLTFFNLLFSANMLWWSHYSDRERELTLGEVARLQPVARRAMSGCLRPTAASATPLAVGSVECPLADSIAVGRKASELVFLHHCCSDREPQPTWSFADFRGKDEYNLLGHYLVGYADGTSEAVEIRYGDNIARLDLTFGEHQASTPFWAEPVSQGRDREGKRVTFWSHTWTNPRPEVEIVAVAVNPDRCEEGERIVLVSLAALPL
jgi:hexosaminidase